MSQRADFRKRLTDRLVEFIEENDGTPWQKGWNAVNVRPFNPATGVKYRGGNVLSLLYGALERESDDPRWMTLKQANAAGLRVRKGARGELVEYWDWGQPKEARKREVDAEGNPVETDEAADADRVEATGRVDDEPRRRPVVFYAVVFNGRDIGGLPELKREIGWKPNELAEQLIAATGAQIEHRVLSRGSGGLIANQAYYDKVGDKSVLPVRESFKSDGDYYATVLHELAHWTGHRSRLARFDDEPVDRKSEAYAREELRADIAAMFLTSMLGVEGSVQNHAKYTKSWLKLLNDDRHEIFRAARDAERIVDYLLDFAPELRIVTDARLQANVLPAGGVPKKIATGIAPLPNFIPPHAEEPNGTGRADRRWPVFEDAVRTESRKYGISDTTLERTLELVQPRFSEVLDAAKRNNFTVDDMSEMLAAQLVGEMRANTERERKWNHYCQQVRAAARDLMSPEQVELALQGMGQRYQLVLQRAATEGWDTDRTDEAVRATIYGDAGRRPITADYVRDTFIVSAAEVAVSEEDDEEELLRPHSAVVAFEDASPADAAAVPDEKVHSEKHEIDSPSPA